MAGVQRVAGIPAPTSGRFIPATSERDKRRDRNTQRPVRDVFVWQMAIVGHAHASFGVPCRVRERPDMRRPMSIASRK